jgi:hypothetical protein
VLLVVLAAGWAGLTLYAASRVPGPGLVLPLMIGFGLVVIALAWAGAAFMSWAFKRRMSVAGWISVPAAVVLVFALPWQAWFWGARVRSAGPELAALSDRYEYLREGDFRAIEPASRAGAFEVVRVTRLKGGTALALTSGSGHETGLLRAGGDVAPAPEWATSRRARRLGGEWWRYEWRGE